VNGGVKGGIEGGVEGGVAGGVSEDRRRARAEHELQRLTEKIELRSHRHQAVMKELEEEIETLASRVRPTSWSWSGSARRWRARPANWPSYTRPFAREPHRERLRETGRGEAAPGRAAGRDGGEGGQPPLVHEELRQIHEKASSLAELAKPSQEEIRELQRAAAEMASLSSREASEMAHGVSEAVEQAREEVRRAQTRCAAPSPSSRGRWRRRAPSRRHGGRSNPIGPKTLLVGLARGPNPPGSP